jgi:hypothetical protein
MRGEVLNLSYQLGLYMMVARLRSVCPPVISEGFLLTIPKDGLSIICIILRNIDTEAMDYDLLLYCYLKVILVAHYLSLLY